MKKFTYYFLSFTWGLPLTFVGLLTAGVLLLLGQKPKKFHWAYYFELGKNWGGIDLGIIFICCKTLNEQEKAHEFGHSVQNCRFGLFMPFLVAFPSLFRYWYRTLRTALHRPCKTKYDAAWFEKQATRLGMQYIRNS